MNPRGRQYALAGTLPGWARLDRPDRKQARALRLAYRGLNPWVYSRYGRRQWAAPLPWTRLIVKDPFAMMSMPAVSREAGARCVLVYRHPGAVLASYRRMGWRPDLDELRPLVAAYRASAGPGDIDLPELPRLEDVGEPEAMGAFWSALHAIALAGADDTPGLLVLSHEELSSGGPDSGRRLFDELGLVWTADSARELAREATRTPVTAPPAEQRLHNFDRSPGEVAAAWRAKLEPEEIERIEAVTSAARDRLEQVRFKLG